MHCFGQELRAEHELTYGADLTHLANHIRTHTMMSNMHAREIPSIT